MRSMIKNKDYAVKKRSIGENETEKALFLLEDSYMDKSGRANNGPLNDSSKIESDVFQSPERVNLPPI